MTEETDYGAIMTVDELKAKLDALSKSHSVQQCIDVHVLIPVSVARMFPYYYSYKIATDAFIVDDEGNAPVMAQCIYAVRGEILKEIAHDT